MPSRAPRPCGKPGCGALVTDNRFCDDHTDQAKQTDHWRGSASSRGYDHEWSKLRLVALKRDKYLCQRCLAMKPMRVTSALEVHHIVAITVDPSRRLDLDNLISLCIQCHREVTFKRR